MVKPGTGAGKKVQRSSGHTAPQDAALSRAEGVVLEETSLRDGLQAESRLFGLAEKMEIVRLLHAAGIRRLQVGSFVSPRALPQMANTDVLVSLAARECPEMLITALVLNRKGLERALHCGLDHISLSASVSDVHSRSNTGRPAKEALDQIVGLIAEARAAGVRVRAGVQCAFACRSQGVTPRSAVLTAVEAMVGAGADEINLADTTGMAHPHQISELVTAVRVAHPEVTLSLHLHDTRGLGLVNLHAGYGAGVRVFDVACGGLGGCPNVPGAGGNVATEDAVHLLAGLGAECGIDLSLLCRAVARFEELLGRTLPGRMCRELATLAAEAGAMPGGCAIMGRAEQ